MVCLEAGLHGDMHTGGWIVERVSWLVSNHTNRWVERREGGLAGQQTNRRGQVDELAGHPGG